MSNEYIMRFGRWVKEKKLRSSKGYFLTASLEVKSDNGDVNDFGKNTIEWFCSDFEAQWNYIIDSLLEKNLGYGKKSIEESISQKINIIAPALVGSEFYDLLIFLDLEIKSACKKSYYIVYNNKKIVSIDELEKEGETKNWSADVAGIIEGSAAKCFKLDFDEINMNLDMAEYKCQPLLNTDSERLEVKRRILEWKVRLYCDKNQPLDVVNNVYDNLVELGYSNIGVEASIDTYYAEYLIKLGEIYKAKNILKGLIQKIKNLPLTVNFDWCKKMIEYSEKLLEQCEK